MVGTEHNGVLLLVNLYTMYYIYIYIYKPICRALRSQVQARRPMCAFAYCYTSVCCSVLRMPSFNVKVVLLQCFLALQFDRSTGVASELVALPSESYEQSVSSFRVEKRSNYIPIYIINFIVKASNGLPKLF